MKLVFFGTPEIAVPSLRALLDAGHEIALAVTQPDRPRGRGKKVSPCPVKAEAEARGIEVITPTRLKDPALAERLTALNLDAGVVIAYGRILPKRLLDIPRLGLLNIHTSLLPKFRGPSPIYAAIREGEQHTGVTIMKVVEELDAGPIYLQEIVQLQGTESLGALEAKLGDTGAAAIVRTLDLLGQGMLEAREQNHTLATHTRILTREDGRIDWTKTVGELNRQARACDPWPAAFSLLHPAGGGEPMRLNIYRLAPSQTAAADSTKPGTVVLADGRQLAVKCGDGVVSILELQPTGKNRMRIDAFLRGRKIDMGARFE